MKRPPLRKLLTQAQVGQVDALLRRIEHLLSSSTCLTASEKKEVSEGAQALRGLFYDGRFSNSDGKPLYFDLVKKPKHWVSLGKTSQSMSAPISEHIDSDIDVSDGARNLVRRDLECLEK